MDDARSNGEPSDSWWRAHLDETSWHVKWGFDSGDCFTVFPLIPRLSEEDEERRWERSFVPLRDTDELLSIESEIVDALLRRVLETRFDAALPPNGPEGYPWRSPKFDWYFDNAYTTEACRGICSLMRSAAESLSSYPAGTPVRLDETGGVVTEEPASGSTLSATDARKDCLCIADLLEKVVVSAEGQGALVCFSGP